MICIFFANDEKRFANRNAALAAVAVAAAAVAGMATEAEVDKNETNNKSTTSMKVIYTHTHIRRNDKDAEKKTTSKNEKIGRSAPPCHGDGLIRNCLVSLEVGR